MNDQFVVTAFQEALAIDALVNVEPIAATPAIIQDIYAKFNSLTSNRGLKG